MKVTNGKDVARLLVDEYLNCHPTGHKKFMESMAKEQQEIKDNYTYLGFAWLKGLSEVRYYDLRNEASKLMADDLCLHVKEQPERVRLVYDGAEEMEINPSDEEQMAKMFTCYLLAGSMDGYGEFVDYALDTHRTLQQNLTRFFVEWFAKAFNFPTGFSHGEFYVNVSTMESIPEGCTLYAVYTSPLDDTVKRVKLSQDSSTLLKNTSVKYSSKAILSIGFEVRKNGNILQSVEVPIHYKARLNELTVSDSWGHELSTGLQDTTESQNLEVTVPKNTEYIDIAGSDNDCYGSIAEHPELIAMDGVELIK